MFVFIECDYLYLAQIRFMLFRSAARYEPFNPFDAEIPLCKPWRPKGFFQFEIIINVLVSSF